MLKLIFSAPNFRLRRFKKMGKLRFAFRQYSVIFFKWPNTDLSRLELVIRPYTYKIESLI